MSEYQSKLAQGQLIKAIKIGLQRMMRSFLSLILKEPLSWVRGKFLQDLAPLLDAAAPSLNDLMLHSKHQKDASVSSTY